MQYSSKNSFGRRLEEARRDKNMMQSELAELLNVKQATVSAWERGKNEPSMEMFKKIVKILEVDLNFLFGLDE